MNQEISLKVKAEFIQDYKNAYPLITKESLVDFEQLKIQGSIVRL